MRRRKEHIGFVYAYTNIMLKIVVFTGNNEDNFFVEANKIIYGLENRKEMEDYTGFNIKMGYICNANENTFDSKKIPDYLKAQQRFDYCMLKELISEQKKDYCYLLHIEGKETRADFTYNVIPLRLFTILRREYRGKIFLSIDLDNKDFGNAARIAGYMLIDNLSEMYSWESEWELAKNKNEFQLHIKSDSLKNNPLYNQVYINTEKINRLQIHGVGSLNKILPCIYWDWEWQMMFTSSVNEIYKDFRAVETESRKGIPIKNDYIYKLQKGLWEFAGSGDVLQETYSNTMSENEWKRYFYKTIICDICLDNLKDSGVLKATNAPEVFALCENMSVLSLLLFSAFCHFVYETSKKELEKTQINNLCQSAQDFADGLLQLMENTLDYAQGGCLSFRIHSGNSKYFENHYENFTINDQLFYLEVLITDLNYNESIPQKFISNLEKRALTDELSEELKDKLADKITLQGFFKPDRDMEKLWNEYYMIAENITNHYGLQLFNTLVSYYQGYFSVSSGRNSLDPSSYFVVNYGEKKGKDIYSRMRQWLPGTQYSILLPIKKQEEQKRVGIDIYPSFDDIALKNRWGNTRIRFDQLLNGIETEKDSRENKKENIKKIAENCHQNYKKKEVFVIDLRGCACIRYVELLAKAMITFILHHQGDKLRVAIINASHEFMVGFTRFFAIFYNKNARCTSMKNVQLFLCDDRNKAEITFAGESLAAAYAANELWANSKGEYNECLEILQIILEQRMVKSSQRKKAFKVAPFELLIRDENNITLFEQRVRNDLMQNIQKEEFGCLLSDIHMRVGAKMHVTDHFFETFQLFNSSLYNSRFAYLIAHNIKSKIKNRISNDLVIVGYDTYSELLILETQKILKQVYNISVRCLVYEQFPHPRFRMWKDNMKNSQFVIIVPTSTTLTTHGKITVELANRVGHDISGQILMNIALILIRDSSEKTEEGDPGDAENPLQKNLSVVEQNYWYSIDSAERRVRVKTSKPETIVYNVLVESKWQEPMRCKSCYPAKLTDEKPIIEVDRASVVPMIMAGPQESSLSLTPNISTDEDDLIILKDAMLYGHIKRENNHFQYYFKTDELMQNILGNESYKKRYDEWLEKVRLKVSAQKDEVREIRKHEQIPHVYNILVAPIHETNAAFLETINNEIFQGVPIVLYIDSDREYRENIQSKYSNLTALYNNISHTGRAAIINFHYVDDTINSGISIRRTYSLLKSLFPEQAYNRDSQVKVNLFQNIFLLLNRSSRSTVSGLPCKGVFFAFFNLQISGLRNHHENACALCSEVSNYETLKIRTVTNELTAYWEKAIEDKRVRGVPEVEYGAERQERYFRRLICTHEINQMLLRMNWNRNRDEKVKDELKETIKRRLTMPNYSADMKIEYVMAYFTVLSRPYLSYRKSILDVVFPFLLETMEAVLSLYDKGKQNIEGTLTKDIYINTFIKGSAKLKKDFIKVMIGAISRLGACYLIRAKVINRLFSLAEELEFDPKEFELFYGAAIKRLITLGKDESVGLWLEYLILTGKEYGPQNGERLKINSNFRDFLFYENTYIIADAVDELVYKKIKVADEITSYFDKYYFDNFRKLMSIDYFGELSGKLSETENNEIRKILWGLVRFKNHLEGQVTDSEADNYYVSLINIIKDITNASYLCIYGIDNNDQIYIISSLIRDYYSTGYFRKIEQERKKHISDTNDWNDTVYFYKKNTVLVCIMGKGVDCEEKSASNVSVNRNSRNNNDLNSDSIWIMLEFTEGDAFSTKTVASMKFAIRNILVYKYLLSERIKDDFRKNTFSRIKELFVKNKLLSNPKTGTHTPDEILKKIEFELKAIKKEDIQDKSILKWAGFLLQMAADSLISKLYVESIVAGYVEQERVQESNQENLQNNNRIVVQLSFEKFVFTDEIEGLLMQMEYLNKDQEDPTLANISVDKTAEKFNFSCPPGSRYCNLLILAAIVQNAVKHGRVESSNRVRVEVSSAGKYLIVRNKMKEMDEVKGDEAEQSGITIPALKHYFMKNFGSELKVKEDKKAGTFEVQLPVVRSE